MKPISTARPEQGGSTYQQKPFKPKKPGKKPSEKFCAEQLLRLATKKRAPFDDEGGEYRLKQVRDVLFDASEDDDHVKRIVDRLEKDDTFPGGYEVRTAAYETRSREMRPNPRCEKCMGLGQVVIPIPGKQAAAKRCDCYTVVEAQQ